MLALVSISAVIILALFLLLRGVSTGNAIYFQSEDELSQAVKEKVENNILNNQFYAKVSSLDLCLEVKDGENVVSYTLLKTPSSHYLEKAATNCDDDTSHDIAVKFTNWESFNTLAGNLTCDNILSANLGQKNVLILPSRLVLAGYKLNEAQKERAQSYCPVLKSCLLQSELDKIGICPEIKIQTQPKLHKKPTLPISKLASK